MPNFAALHDAVFLLSTKTSRGGADTHLPSVGAQAKQNGRLKIAPRQERGNNPSTRAEML